MGEEDAGDVGFEVFDFEDGGDDDAVGEDFVEFYGDFEAAASVEEDAAGFGAAQKLGELGAGDVAVGEEEAVGVGVGGEVDVVPGV